MSICIHNSPMRLIWIVYARQAKTNSSTLNHCLVAQHPSRVCQPSTLARVGLVHILPNRSSHLPVFSEYGALKVKWKLIIAWRRLYKLHAIKLGVRVDNLAPAVHSNHENNASFFTRIWRDFGSINFIVQWIKSQALCK